MIVLYHDTMPEKDKWAKDNLKSNEYQEITLPTPYSTVIAHVGDYKENWTQIKTKKNSTKLRTIFLWRMQYDNWFDYDIDEDPKSNMKDEFGYSLTKGKYRKDNLNDEGEVTFDSMIEFSNYDDEYYLMIDGEKVEIDCMRQG